MTTQHMMGRVSYIGIVEFHTRTIGNVLLFNNHHLQELRYRFSHKPDLNFKKITVDVESLAFHLSQTDKTMMA